MTSQTNHIQNIAHVGATGQVGGHILSSLLSSSHPFNITAITRSSGSSLPTDPKLRVLTYTTPDASFFASAFQGIDALVISLGHTASQDLQSLIVEAAIKAGVKWILPNEWGSDGAHPHMGAGIPINKPKGDIRKLIAEKGAGKTNFISVVNNPWYDFSFKTGMFSIDPLNRKATLYDDGQVKFNTTTLATVGRSVAALLALPTTSTDGSPSLSGYANNFVYISSFHVNQRDILRAAQQATNTTDADWDFQHRGAKEYVDEGWARLGKGDFMGLAAVLYGSHFLPDLGGDYENSKKKLGDVVDVGEKEDLVQVTGRLVEEMQRKGTTKMGAGGEDGK